MSLRLKLMLTLGLSLTLLWVATAVWVFEGISRRIDDTLDQRLVASAHMISNLIGQLPVTDLGELEAVQSVVAGVQGVACQVRSRTGSLLLQTHPLLPADARSPAPGWSRLELDGTVWRLYTLDRHGILVSTADRLDERQALRNSFLTGTALSFTVALLGSLALLWLILTRTFRPLSRLTGTLADLSPTDLAPLPDRDLPLEIVPLVRTINGLFARFGDTLERETRFTSNAAHELRTPLTAAKTQLQLVQRAAPERRTHHLSRAEHALERLERIINQLLTLARIDSDQVDTRPGPASVGSVLEELAAHYPIAPVLSVSSADRARLTPIDSDLWQVAVRNLVDNALCHGDGLLRMQVQHQHGQLQVQLCNRLADGTQLPAAAGERFRRGPTSQGAGLGLSIVEALCRRYAGQLTLDPGTDTLTVVLTFPAAAAAPV